MYRVTALVKTTSRVPSGDSNCCRLQNTRSFPTFAEHRAIISDGTPNIDSSIRSFRRRMKWSIWCAAYRRVTRRWLPVHSWNTGAARIVGFAPAAHEYFRSTPGFSVDDSRGISSVRLSPTSSRRVVFSPALQQIFGNASIYIATYISIASSAIFASTRAARLEIRAGIFNLAKRGIRRRQGRRTGRAVKSAEHDVDYFCESDAPSKASPPMINTFDSPSFMTRV